MTPEQEALAARAVAALEQIAVVLTAMQMTLVGEGAPPCPHPESERVDRGSTMGHPRWRCKQCGHDEGTTP